MDLCKQRGSLVSLGDCVYRATNLYLLKSNFFPVRYIRTNRRLFLQLPMSRQCEQRPTVVVLLVKYPSQSWASLKQRSGHLPDKLYAAIPFVRLRTTRPIQTPDERF